MDDTAAVAPDRLAVADQHDRYTYAELVRHSSALARWLLDQDLRPGTAIALQSSNRVAIPLVHLACDRADLTFLPVPDCVAPDRAAPRAGALGCRRVPRPARQ